MPRDLGACGILYISKATLTVSYTAPLSTHHHHDDGPGASGCGLVRLLLAVPEWYVIGMGISPVLPKEGAREQRGHVGEFCFRHFLP